MRGARSDRTISSVGSPVRRQAVVISHPATTPTTIPPSPDDDERHARTDEGEGTRRRADRDAVGDEGRGVVDQALALEDRDDPWRHAEPAQHGRCGHRVRRGHDGAQGEGRRRRAARGSTRETTTPTTTVVNSTSPMASSPIARAFALRSRIGVLKPEPNRIGGRKSRKTRSGSRWTSASRSGATGNPRPPRARPPSTSRIGYGDADAPRHIGQAGRHDQQQHDQLDRSEFHGRDPCQRWVVDRFAVRWPARRGDRAARATRRGRAGPAARCRRPA